MEPWVRKLLAIPVVTVALVCVVAAIGSAKAHDQDNPEIRGLSHVPLRGEDMTMAVRSVVLNHKGKTYLLETRDGLEVRNQHRLPLANIPFLGQITEPPFERTLFAEEHKVADVTAEKDRLFIALPDSADLPANVVIFNQNHGFFLKDQPAPQADRIPAEGKVIASAYYQQDGGNLLIMVRPSIILDGAFF